MKSHLILDFEYREVDSGKLEVLCVCARNLESGRSWKVWLGGDVSPQPIFPHDADTIFVAHSVTQAEARCLLELGWPVPEAWIDTYIEERILAGGRKPQERYGLLACCRRRGIPVMEDYQKKEMRALCMRVGPYSEEEKQRILDYCEEDVKANTSLFEAIRTSLNVPQSLLRGRTAVEYARIHARGVPVDTERLAALKGLGNDGLRKLFSEKFDDFGITEKGRFSMKSLNRLIGSTGVPWPKTSSGLPKTNEATLKQMAKAHGEPWVGIGQLLKVLNGTAVDKLELREDGRVASDLRPFGTLTGRCAPSSSSFLWSGPKWLRFMLRPPVGKSIVVIDWSNQEFAIAGALSGDNAMAQAYQSGDPYMSLAKAAGRVPHDGTPDTHPKERAQFKVVSLGVLMGMSASGVAGRLGVHVSEAEALLKTHRKVYERFWRWSDGVMRMAAANRPIETSFGMRYQAGPESKARTARNFLLQATGADMLRIALLLLAAQHVRVICTIHDAVMIECETDGVDRVTAIAEGCMQQASRIVLWDRLTVRTDTCRVDYPSHFQDAKGKEYWVRLAGLLDLPLDRHGG